MMDSEAPVYAVGKRVIDKDGNKGTVRYVGPVCISKEANSTWIGVEWDKEGRGKYDGSVVSMETARRVRYFSCGEGMGSFVKADTLSPGSLLGVVLWNRYAPETNDTSGMSELNIPTVGGNSVKVEVYLKESEEYRCPLSPARSLDQLKRKESIPHWNLSCSDDCVALIDEDEALIHLIPNCQLLDLSQNLLSDWCEVLKLQVLPRLEQLNLSFNRLRVDDSFFGRGALPVFSSLKELVLSNTETSWETTCRLFPSLPALTELYLPGNGISHISSSPNPFPANLQLLDLSKNELSDWSEIFSFSALSKLHTLLLSYNPQLPDLPAETPVFPEVILLSLISTNVSSVETIERLVSLCPRIERFGLHSTPLTKALGPNNYMFEIIARMKNLKRLNGSEVGRRKRADSEIYYMTLCLEKIMSRLELKTHQAWVNYPADKKQEITRSIFRYDELAAIYGEVAPKMDSSASGVKIIAKIQLECRPLSNYEPIIKESQVPISMKIGILKKLCETTFKKALKKPVRLFIRSKDDLSSTLLDNETLPLSMYGIVDDATIIIEEFDEKAERAEREREKQRLDRQIDQWLAADAAADSIPKEGDV